MRYELTDFEWTAIRPFLPNKSRGVPRVNDRRVLNGIFWILRSGAPWIYGAPNSCLRFSNLQLVHFPCQTARSVEHVMAIRD
jgi:transposase